MIKFLAAFWFALLLAAVPTAAADLPDREADLTPQAETAAGYLDRFAVLLMIRSTFDVVDPESIEETLSLVARDIAEHGPSPEASLQLDHQLLTEGGYYLVSLKYLALAGGAAWPDDRTEASYERDAVFELEGLEAALIDSVAARRDPLPVLLAAQHILGLTEGYVQLPPQMDRFADRDAHVDAALLAAGLAD